MEVPVGRCELTGKSRVVKNLVSHSNIKTKSSSQPNIQKKRIFSQALGSLVTLRVATSTIRAMEHKGGLDKYLLGLEDGNFSKRALAVKSRIRQKLAVKKKPAAAKTDKKSEKA
jgi:large subunit ribosomal protein L28